MFWEKFIRLCNEKNTKPNNVAKALGIPSGSVTDWKNGRTPRSTTVQKLADYFGVTADYLLGKASSTESTADVETVIQRTKLLLKEKGLKQKYLFDQLGTSRMLFQYWKTGVSTPSDDMLGKIADVLDTTPEYLLGKTDRKSKPHISEEYLKLIEEREAHTALVMGFGGDRQIIEVPEGAEEVILATIAAWRKKQAEENKKK